MMLTLHKCGLLGFYFCLGFVFQFPSVAMRFWLMNEIKISPSQMAAIFGIVSIPWCMKPVYGFISDSFPIYGYRRRPYMIMCAYFASLMWICLPFAKNEALITFLMTMSSMCMCFTDVMIDSLLVEEARLESDASRGIIQSYSWMMRLFGGLLASVTGAFAYNGVGAHQVFWINSMVPMIIVLLAVLVNDRPHVSQTQNYSETASKLWSALRKPSIFKPAAFIFLISATPGYGTAMTYFYQHVLHFTPAEFGMLDVMEYIVSIIGTWVYKTYLRHVSFKRIFAVALILSFLLENTLFLLIFHINRDMHIPDFVFAAVERIVITLVGQFISMPMVVMGARVCPKGIEGSLYALLMSISNIGGVLSSEWGSMLMNMYGITGTNFVSLWKLMLTCHGFDLLPLFGISLVSPATINPTGPLS